MKPNNRRRTPENSSFAFSTAKDGRVFITWRGKQVSVLKGAKGAAFLARVSGADGPTQQLEMARVTGNFKRGNERQGGGNS